MDGWESFFGDLATVTSLFPVASPLLISTNEPVGVSRKREHLGVWDEPKSSSPRGRLPTGKVKDRPPPYRRQSTPAETPHRDSALLRGAGGERRSWWSNSRACLNPGGAGGLKLHNSDGRNAALKRRGAFVPNKSKQKPWPQMKAAIMNVYEGKRHLVLLVLGWIIKQGGFLSLNPQEQHVKKRFSKTFQTVAQCRHLLFSQHLLEDVFTHAQTEGSKISHLMSQNNKSSFLPPLTGSLLYLQHTGYKLDIWGNIFRQKSSYY